jgi:hypothetical protein
MKPNAEAHVAFHFGELPRDPFIARTDAIRAVSLDARPAVSAVVWVTLLVSHRPRTPSRN